MKRNDVPILIATAVYSFLFYKQSAGVNYFLFNLILVSLLVIRDANLISSRGFLAAAIGCITSSLFIFWYDTPLPFTANMISLILLAGLSFDRSSSFIIACFHSLYSFIGVPVFILMDTFRGFTTPGVDQTRTKMLNKAILAILPILVFIVFFDIYRSGNPIFDQLAAKINFDFISI